MVKQAVSGGSYIERLARFRRYGDKIIIAKNEADAEEIINQKKQEIESKAKEQN